MRLHYLQHVSFEGLGSIERWATMSGVGISCTRLFQNESLPSIEEFDFLVVMGGPMSIYEEETFPWLVPEKIFIRKTIDNGKHVMGICLGAQLIADSLGARVYPSKQKEIGWFPIQVACEAPQDLRNIFSQNTEVMHWHGDTFDLPDGSIPLAGSKACRNQGFVYNDKVIALQFHLETTKQSLEDLITNCGDEIVAAPYIQESTAMLADNSRFKSINSIMDNLLDYWTKGARSAIPLSDTSY